MNKNLVLLTISIFGFSTSLTSCNQTNNKLINNQDNNILTLEAISAMNLQNEFNLNTKKMKSSSTPTFDVEELVNKTNVILNTNIFVETFDSDKENFILKQVATINDLSYTMYFDSISTKEKEDKIKEKYSGIVVFNEQEYKFSACKKIETEDDEYEEELHFKLFINDYSTVYVKHEYEKEDGEYEESFSYKYVENNQEIKSYKIKKEVETNEKEIKYEEGNSEYKLTYFTKKSVDYLEVEYNEEKYLYKIVLNNAGNYSYELV